MKASLKKLIADTRKIIQSALMPPQLPENAAKLAKEVRARALDTQSLRLLLKMNPVEIATAADCTFKLVTAYQELERTKVLEKWLEYFEKTERDGGK